MNYDYDTYEDEAIIEAALDIYDQYDVSMEEAIDIAMEAFKNNPIKSVYNKAYNKVFPYTSKKKSGYFDSRRKKVDDGINEANKYAYTEKERFLLEGLKKIGSEALNTEENILKERERSNIRIGAAAALGAGAGAAAVGAGVALHKYRNKKLAEAAKAEKEAEELDSRAAREREKAQRAIAQAKEAASFDYD